MSSRPAVLVKHTEHPEGNTIENTRLNTVNCEETIGDIFDLIECLIKDNNKFFLIRENSEGKKEFHQLDIHDANIINSPYYYLQQNDVVYVENKKSVARNAFFSSNTSMWFTLTSMLMSVATFILAVSK